MRILEISGISVLALFILLLGVFLRLRLLLINGGGIRLQVRVTTVVPGRGWSPGIGQFVGDELHFHRMFSFGVRPKRVVSRCGLVVAGPRLPDGTERHIMPKHWVILSCTDQRGAIEIAMAEPTVTGLLSWLEAAPPGAPGSVAPRTPTRPRPAAS